MNSRPDGSELMANHGIVVAMLVAQVVAIGPVRAAGTIMLPAPEWIADCIRRFESPEGRKPFENLGRGRPRANRTCRIARSNISSFSKASSDVILAQQPLELSQPW